jgi:beta-glucosidase
MGRKFRNGAKSLFAIILSVPVVAGPLRAADPQDPASRAALTVRKMQPDEKVVLTHGIMPLAIGPAPPPIPADAISGAGYVTGIPRLNIPALRETDASLGVSYVAGLRKDGATALPSGLAMASTWNPELIEQGGRMIGNEARTKGFNVMLAGGVNLMRDPRSGRNFEYFGEDPLLAGTLVGYSIRGIQSNHIISTIKHLALNGQETGRKFADVEITEAAARESDLLAFKIGIEIGNPGSVMCAYNRIHGEQACSSDWLLNKVLKKDWGFRGFVMSDWGAVPSVHAALDGLDQQSGDQLDPKVFFGDDLAQLSRQDPQYRSRLDDMNRRILFAVYANGLDKYPAVPGGHVDSAQNALVAEQVIRQGIVLLRNRHDILPLATSARRIAVIGGHADFGVISGGGSSQVHAEGGPAAAIPMAAGPMAGLQAQQFQRSVPLDAIRGKAAGGSVRYRNGRYISEAVELARQSDVTIVFATQWSGEGFDQPDLSLPEGQDALISAVADANPNTIVVLETGGPVLMPWLDKTAAVLQSWYPGARGAEAIASVLFGEVNPSGRLPITFPASEAQLPRPKVDGFNMLEPDFFGNPPTPETRLPVDYGIEGSDLGYRWNARRGYKALFPFGFGLSYTSFESGALTIDGLKANATIKNTGQRAGATVVQVYLVSRNGQPKQRLVGFERIELVAGTSESATIAIDPRLLADWIDGAWQIAGGQYAFALGDNAESLGAVVTARISPRRWKN